MIPRTRITVNHAQRSRTRRCVAFTRRLAWPAALGLAVGFVLLAALVPQAASRVTARPAAGSYFRLAVIADSTIQSAQVADLDGDGDQDIAGIRTATNALVWWENKPRACVGGNRLGEQFEEHTLDAGGTRTLSQLSLGDLNGDGRLDILTLIPRVSVPQLQLNRLDRWYNNGGGAFQRRGGLMDMESSNFPRITSIAVANLSMSNQADFITVTEGGRIDHWRNRDDNALTPSFERGQTSFSSGERVARQVDFADTNGDGRADRAAVAESGRWGWWVLSYSRPTLSFSQSGSIYNATGIAGTAIGDLDDDGDMDVAVLDDTDSVHAWRNAGDRFTHQTTALADLADVPPPVTGVAWTSIDVADVNGDAAEDLLLPEYGPGQGGYVSWWSPASISVCQAVGPTTTASKTPVPGGQTATPTPAPTRQIPASQCRGSAGTPKLQRSAAWSSAARHDSTSVAWGDVNRDGFLDLAFGNRGAPGGYSVEYYLSDHGRLPPQPSWHAGTGDAAAIAWGDMNGDGWLDLAVAYDGAASRVYLNPGTGDLLDTVDPWSSSSNFQARDVAWVDINDVNGDRRPELAILTPGGVRIFQNEGSRLSRTASAPISLGADNTAMAWGHADNHDGWPDLALGTKDGQVGAYLNNGSGVLIPPTADSRTTLSDRITRLEWADMNGDKQIDLVVGSGWSVGAFISQQGSLRLVDPYWVDSCATQVLPLADVDGDGDLDLARVPGMCWAFLDLRPGAPLPVGRPLIVSAFENGSLGGWNSEWVSDELDNVTGGAWGDMDGDGDLDLAVATGQLDGRSSFPNRVYLNLGGNLQPNLLWESDTVAGTRSIDLGDADDDGDLDLAVGERIHEVFEIDGSRLAFGNVLAFVNGPAGLANGTSVKTSEQVNTNQVAWADMDRRGSLDLAVANEGQPARLFNLRGDRLEETWRAPGAWQSTAVAWSDVDGDGWLDLTLGNYALDNAGAPSIVFKNVNGSLRASPPLWAAARGESTQAVAWADPDQDGDLDLAVANDSHPSRLYLNDNGHLDTVPFWSSDLVEPSRDLAWGDVNRDGLVDLAIGNAQLPKRLYLNIGGTLETSPSWSSVENDNTYDLELTDIDGDGDLDLVAGSYAGPLRVYENHSGRLDSTASQSQGLSRFTSISVGDVDGDGDSDVALGDELGTLKVVEQSRPSLAPAACQAPPQLRIELTAPARPYGRAEVNPPSTATIRYRIFDPGGRQWHIRGFFSPDGGGLWLPASSAANGSAPVGSNTWQDYMWDAAASDFFGKVDQMAIRLAAIPDAATKQGEITQSFQLGHISAETMPFPTRGRQVRVKQVDGAAAANAMVFRRTPGSSRTGSPLADAAGKPFRTDAGGYLQGRGKVNRNDLLIALAPATPATDAPMKDFQAFQSSATVLTDGLRADPVQAPAVTEITVSPDNPLLVFNLDVSLEWDARNDPQFLARLTRDFERASEHLFDWSNGRIALGDITVYHDRAHWGDAHIRIYATNRLRPNANQGGVVTKPFTETLQLRRGDHRVVYDPGQVRIGAVWSRYGDAGDSLGDDWARTLAHELGHYLLFLDDNYLGLNDTGTLIPIDDCTGTAMSDPYRDDFSEFHPSEGWLPGCERTLSNQNTGRSDWSTIKARYPALAAVSETNPGPVAQPLALTRVHITEPVTPTTALPAPILSLTEPDGRRTIAGPSARAFLFRAEGDRITDLGQPMLDQLDARGGRPGDRVCVFDQRDNTARMGCRRIGAASTGLALVERSSWRPEVVVQPSSGIQVGVQVANLPAGRQIAARLYAEGNPAAACVSLTRSGTVYRSTFAELAQPASSGLVHIWEETDGNASRCEEPSGDLSGASEGAEAVVVYALGGNPGFKLARGGFKLARGGFKLARGAPATSPDGQVIIFGDVEFGEGELYALQPAGLVPDLPPWATLVGQAYRLAASSKAPSLSNSDPDQPRTSISFNYLGRDVPPGEEAFVQAYKWNEIARGWDPLETKRDSYHNIASAATDGPGLYALLSSVEITLPARGWNQLGYPIRGTQAVTDALKSIDGQYNQVWGWNNQLGQWELYAPGGPSELNRLTHLEFGKGYWINLTVEGPVTLKLRGGFTDRPGGVLVDQWNRDERRLPVDHIDQRLPGLPPAMYHGRVLSGDGFSSSAGQPTTATISGKVCGETTTRRGPDGSITYSIQVLAAGSPPSGGQGCGIAGERAIGFQVNGWRMLPSPTWNNTDIWRLDLRPAIDGVATPPPIRDSLFLPATSRDQ